MSARRVLVPPALALAVLWPAAIPATAQDPSPPEPCATIMPFEQVDDHIGETGIGWTVPRDTDPQPFAAEIVDTFEDGIRPGFDIILIRVSDLPGHQFIENARGIWAGMSGSPVYVDGKLIGAVAWGFSAGPSKLGGVTPIEEMERVANRDLSSMSMSTGLRRALQRFGRASVQPSEFGPLPIPMILRDTRTRGPRGGSPKKRAEIRSRFDLRGRLADRDVDIVRTNVGARVARAVRPAAIGLVPGGNIGSALSEGALDAIGFGTVTDVCIDRVLAFGHDFFLTGASNMGAYHSRTLDVVDDPTFAPFKLSVPLAPLLGKVTQDRGAAIVARLDRMPEILEVISRTGRTGGPTPDPVRTDVYVQTPRFLVSILPSDHAFFELLDFVDAFEDGSVGVELRVIGRRENGTQFDVTFGDRWIGAERPNEEFFDSVSAGAIAVGLMLSWLVENPLEKVKLERVVMDLDVGDANRWLITDIAVTPAGRARQERSPICVSRGDRLTVHVTLESEPGNGRIEEDFSIRVPRQFGSLHVRGGNGLAPFFDPGRFDGFGGLLHHLRHVARADEAIVRIVKDGFTQASTRSLLNRVVVGSASVPLRPLNAAECS